MPRKGLIIFMVIVGFVLLGGMWASNIYNKLVGGEEGVASGWSQVENVYQRRVDLIPNLVETVKGYAAHERETLQSVVEARSKISQLSLSKDVINRPEMLTKFQQAQGELSSALSRLLVVVERYPDLKANQNFLALQTQLEGTENRITVERRRYNEVAREFNTLRRVFPNFFIANFAGFKEKSYFESQEGAEKVPSVKF